MKSKLTPGQLSADLNYDWMNSLASGELQRIRNAFGPTWLSRFKFPKTESNPRGRKGNPSEELQQIRAARKEEAKNVRAALARAGYKANVGHGRGTAWGWLDVDIKKRPAGGSEQEVRRIAEQASGRSTAYTRGNISITDSTRAYSDAPGLAVNPRGRKRANPREHKYLFTITKGIRRADRRLVESAIGPIQAANDYGKKVYRVDGVIQVESNDQRDRRLAKANPRRRKGRCSDCGAPSTIHTKAGSLCRRCNIKRMGLDPAKFSNPRRRAGGPIVVTGNRVVRISNPKVADEVAKVFRSLGHRVKRAFKK